MPATGEELTLVRDRCVRPQDSLLGALVLELRQQCAGNLHSGDHVVLGQLEPELLGVVVHHLDVIQLQRHEALVAARQGLLDSSSRCREGILDLCLGLLCGAGVLCEVVVRARDGSATAEKVWEAAAAGGGGRGWLVGVTANLL